MHGAQLSPVPGQQSLTAARAEPALGVLLWGAKQELFSGDIAVAQSQRFQIRWAFVTLWHLQLLHAFDGLNRKLILLFDFTDITPLCLDLSWC